MELPEEKHLEERFHQRLVVSKSPLHRLCSDSRLFHNLSVSYANNKIGCSLHEYVDFQRFIIAFLISVLQSLSKDKVYIIGGLVDHHVLKVTISVLRKWSSTCVLMKPNFVKLYLQITEPLFALSRRNSVRKVS